MQRQSILVLDAGSSGLKAALFDRAGAVLVQAEAGYATASPQPGRFEQAPEDWAAAARLAVGRLGDLGGVELLALAGTMQNLIPLAADGTPLDRAWLYSDGRAASGLAGFAARMRAVDAAARLGNPVEPLTTAAKLDWLRAQRPDIFESAGMFHAGAKDYLGWRLTGVHATDPTAASNTGLMDLATRAWDAPVLAALGLTPERLPRLLPADAVLGPVTAAAAAWFGLPAGLAVLNGSGDVGAATVGAGIGRSGGAYVYLGTTGWVARNVPAAFPRAAQPTTTMAHPAAGLLIEVASVLSAGDAVAWARDLLGDPAPAEPTSAAAGIEPPLFLPYLKGERSPFHDAGVRGAFLGLDRAHRAGSLRRAVLEGVALAIRHNLAALGGVEGPLGVLGGGASSAEWMQVLADITGLPVAVHANPVGATALGAAMLGSQVLGWELPPPPPAAVLSPNPQTGVRSQRLYGRYLAASAFLRDDAARHG